MIVLCFIHISEANCLNINPTFHSKISLNLYVPHKLKQDKSKQCSTVTIVKDGRNTEGNLLPFRILGDAQWSFRDNKYSWPEILLAMFTYCTVSGGELSRHEAQLIDHLCEDDDRCPTETEMRDEVVESPEWQSND